MIGFYYREDFPPFAGRKAFIVNRIGDFAFLIGMLYLILEFGTLSFAELTEAFQHGHAAGWLLAGVGVLLFFGACGKSAQIPLYVWLPDAIVVRRHSRLTRERAGGRRRRARSGDQVHGH
mgnify:CR=1 FL=1